MLNTNAWVSVSPVELLVQRACDPSLSEPPYAVHIELGELINKKKANTPREAAMATVRLVNHRNPHISVLALALLNSLVQSCGYPMHLQVSTKEFLNELVRRFPERPPPFPGPVMQRILDLIHGWKEGICTESRWKEDLGNIRDMHRLLTFKGYRFRDNGSGRQQQQEASASTSNLKSPDELESEDRDAQAAKLQELIRRGTPRDLAAAQELMKIMAGADPEQKPDYKSQTLKELEKLESKVVLMNEMLDNVDTGGGERFASGDVYDQVATILMSARPKIQRWISDAETEDPESLAVFLQINDQINNTLDRYESFKKGDYAAAANPIPSQYAQPALRNDLIDFDDSSSSSAPASGPSAVDELQILFGSAPIPQNGSASTQLSNQLFGGGAYNGFSAPQPMPFGTTQFSAAQPSLLKGNTQPALFGNIMLPGTPKPNSPPAPTMIPSAHGLGQGSATGQLSMGGQAPLGSGQADAAKKDPFADLAGLF